VFARITPEAALKEAKANFGQMTRQQVTGEDSAL
jgi:hypothetical protein